jgi:hypothetical protein
VAEEGREQQKTPTSTKKNFLIIISELARELKVTKWETDVVKKKRMNEQTEKQRRKKERRKMKTTTPTETDC